MPKYKQETEKYHIERMQKVLTLRPRASARFIQEALELDAESPLHLDLGYILRLRKKIAGERAHRFDRVLVEQEVAQFEELGEAINTEMFKILLGISSSASEKIAAARAIHEIAEGLIELKMNAGIFERKLGSIDVRHSHELTPEQQALILRALANYGIVKYTPEPYQLPAGAAARPLACDHYDQPPKAA